MEQGHSAPKWSGHGVLGVGLAAGLLGWGIASVTMSRDGKGAALLEGYKQWPRYASMKEMEMVRLLSPLPLLVSLLVQTHMAHTLLGRSKGSM